MKVGNSNIDFKGLLIDGPLGCLSMEPKVMKLLRVLVDNAGQVMTREELITSVWGVEYGGDESLSRAISILRKTLGDTRGNHTHIVTISRVGYRLIAEVNLGEPIAAQKITGQSEKIKPPMPLPIPAKANDRAAFPVRNIVALSGFFVVLFGLLFFVLTDRNAKEGGSLQTRLERGFLHVENYTPVGAIEDAQDIFAGILAGNPDHAAARAGLALAVFREYTHLERDPALLQRARAHAEAALREDEHLALANIAVAWAAEFEGDFDRSHEHLDRADILDAGNIFALEGRYRTMGKSGQMDKAREIIDTAISAYPDHALFYTYRGNFFEGQGDGKAAERDLRKAISISPDSPRIYAQLAQSLHSQSRTGDAIETIQQGLAINESALLYNNLGTYLFFQGQYGLAASAFEKTLALSGDTHDYLYWANLGDAYRWSSDKSAEAASNYRRALQLLQVDLDRYPDDANLKSRAALFNAKLGNLDQAQTYMDSFNLTSNSPTIQLYRAVVTYEIMSNRTKALEYLDAAITAKYPMTEILNDPELARLRQDPSYHRLLAKP